jgi:hypothetical protein
VQTENGDPGPSDAELRRRAIDVLVRNHRDGYTVPALGLYPFQWCWDSGPIARGCLVGAGTPFPVPWTATETPPSS